MARTVTLESWLASLPASLQAQKSDKGENDEGCELTWGNHQEIVSLCEKIARREGLGALLADGARSAADKIGKGAQLYAVHLGGQELPMHDPRNTHRLWQTYCTDATPARHMQGGSAYLESNFLIPGVPFKLLGKHTYTGKGDAHCFMSNLSHVVNASGLCYFAVWVYGVNMISQFMEYVTGEQYTLDDLLTIGERIANLCMAFNLRKGVTFSQWEVPGRMIGDPPLQARG